MKEDITYKLNRIKYHRLIPQIQKDITESLSNTIPGGIKFWLEKKYPGITIDINYDNSTYNFNVSIPKPVTYIETTITLNKNEGTL